MVAKAIKVTLVVSTTIFFLSSCANVFCEQCSLPATGQGDWYRNDGKVAVCDDASGFDAGTDVPPGQDGRFMAGCPMEGRFIAEGVVVTDTCTGLVWQRTAIIQKTWAEALVFARDLTLSGFDDWRVPNVNALLSIVDYGTSKPAWNSVFEVDKCQGGGGEGPTCVDTEHADAVKFELWSSTSSQIKPEFAWFVDFAEGAHNPLTKDRMRSMRAVRGGFIPQRPSDSTISACPSGLGP